jgi:hypothetical protein
MAASQICSEERWCPRCKAYTNQSRDIPRWRVFGRFRTLGAVMTVFESPFRTWFCEQCRRRLRPLRRNWFYRQVHSLAGSHSSHDDDDEESESDDE